MLALCSRLALFRSQGDGHAHRSMKLTRYRIHRTGKIRRSSFRRRRRSAARSNGGSMVEEACDAGACWTNAPFSAALESAIPIAQHKGECNRLRGILIVGKKKSRLHWTPCNGVDISLAAYGHGDFWAAALQAHRSKTGVLYCRWSRYMHRLPVQVPCRSSHTDTDHSKSSTYCPGLFLKLD